MVTGAKTLSRVVPRPSCGAYLVAPLVKVLRNDPIVQAAETMWSVWLGSSAQPGVVPKSMSRLPTPLLSTPRVAPHSNHSLRGLGVRLFIFLLGAELDLDHRCYHFIDLRALKDLYAVHNS